MKQAAPVLIVMILHATNLCAQFAQVEKKPHEYKHEFRFTTENDNYIFTYHDGYYTNGIFLQLSSPARPFRSFASLRMTARALKMTTEWRAGQMIFVSEHFRNRIAERIDRPMSGYLFLEKGYRLFFPKGHMLHTALRVGGTGKYSLAKNVQTWYHSAMNLPRVRGWDYALGGEITVDLVGEYRYNVFGIRNRKNCFELMGVASADLGTAFVNGSAGAILKFGNFEDPFNSSFFNSRIGNTIGKRIFVYTYPRMLYQAFNGTVEGPLIGKSTPGISSKIEPWVFMQSWGMHYSEGRFTVAIEYTRKQKEAETMRQKREKYASLSVGYRFGRTGEQTNRK
jgi:hypothetical protein